ncbi:MAG TPA: caspase family protein [Methanoregula sp.]|nr:caspase family protein [Methanoregula sp.]
MTSNRKALCVGINQYKNYPGSALQGCVNDVEDMKYILKTYWGYADADIVTLTDSKATKAAIMKELTDMVEGAKKGKYSYLVFSQSSHGTQVPDTSGDEPDRADEAFCPYDLAQKGNNWDPKYIITDDELHDLFVQLPKNSLLEVFLDACHSGTGLKAVDLLLDRKPRYIPPPSYEAFLEVDNKYNRSFADTFYEKGIIHHILWAGCRSDQTSADANIGGKWHGAFTYCFRKEIDACKNKLARKDLIKKVNACLKKGHYTQVAQLETEATKRAKEIS